MLLGEKSMIGCGAAISDKALTEATPGGASPQLKIPSILTEVALPPTALPRAQKAMLPPSTLEGKSADIARTLLSLPQGKPPKESP
ncbi:hypothetical protein ACLOJK_007170 [Asimina triloba]